MRRVLVATGGRNEYGLLRSSVRALLARPGIDCALLVTGNHADERFGRTLGEIEADGFPVEARVDMIADDDSNLAMAHCTGQGIADVASALDEHLPDMLLMLGDRFEGLAAAVAAYYLRIAVGHIHGGDVTQGGVMDDSVRHAITKLAHVHFAASAQSAERIRRLGEESWRVHQVGAPGLDAMADGEQAAKAEVMDALGWDGVEPLVLGTQHPNTARPEASGAEAVEVLEGVVEAGYRAVMTYPSQDAGRKAIIEALESHAAQHARIAVRPSLGHRLYAGTLAQASAVVGNSSSGLIETTLLGVPTVNVGDRQAGRERAENVLDAPCERHAVAAALRRCVEDTAFVGEARSCSKPYGDGRAGEGIADIIAGLEFGPELLRKAITY